MLATFCKNSQTKTESSSGLVELAMLEMMTLIVGERVHESSWRTLGTLFAIKFNKHETTRFSENKVKNIHNSLTKRFV